MKKAFYAQLQRMVDSCAESDILIVLGTFNATNGTDWGDYASYVAFHGSGLGDDGYSMRLNFATHRRMRIAGIWFQWPNFHRWT